jgi:hypothetical protein
MTYIELVRSFDFISLIQPRTGVEMEGTIARVGGDEKCVQNLCWKT